MSENHLSDDHDSDRAPQGHEGHEPLHEPQAAAGTTPVLHLQSPAHGRRLARAEQAATPAFTYRGSAATKVGWKTAFSFRMMGGYDAREGGEQQHTDQATRQREAISAALVAQGYLSYTRRRIPLPIRRAKVT
jgi:hypothetical protein